MSCARDLGEVLKRYRHATTGVARYAQLGQALLGAIEDGVWKPGDKLPAEAELALQTPYSLGTVQRAYRFLVDRSAIVRIQGSGTYVADERHSMDAPWHCRFLDDKGEAYLPVFAKVLSRVLTDERGPWSAHLRQRENLIRIDRKISINDEFFVYSKFLVNADQFGDLLKKSARELEVGNFRAILDKEFGTPVTRMSQSMSVIPLPSDVRRAMGIVRSRTGLVLDIVASTSSGEPVYYQQLFIPPNPRKLYIDDIVRR